jgi:hypothetical protein
VPAIIADHSFLPQARLSCLLAVPRSVHSSVAKKENLLPLIKSPGTMAVASGVNHRESQDRFKVVIIPIAVQQ